MEDTMEREVRTHCQLTPTCTRLQSAWRTRVRLAHTGALHLLFALHPVRHRSRAANLRACADSAARRLARLRSYSAFCDWRSMNFSVRHGPSTEPYTIQHGHDAHNS